MPITTHPLLTHHWQVRYIEGDITAYELPFWEECFESAPAPLGEAEKAQYLRGLQGVALSSDAFFPFRYACLCVFMLCVLCVGCGLWPNLLHILQSNNNSLLHPPPTLTAHRDSIDHASRYGVQYVAQPGGSIADEEVSGECVSSPIFQV